MPERERRDFLNKLIVTNTNVAASQGKSLAILRPRQSKFFYRRKDPKEIAEEREIYKAAANQFSFFDQKLAALTPCPYEFRFEYTTEDGLKHKATCDDWETTAMFNNFRRRYGETRALTEMERTFNEIYPVKGMVFALGTHSRFPKIWLLVGIVRLNRVAQFSLAV